MTLDDLNDLVRRAKPDHEVLVPEPDPECGPYTKPITVPVSDVAAKLASDYRKITWYEHDEMIGDVEDFTADWKHSE